MPSVALRNNLPVILKSNVETDRTARTYHHLQSSYMRREKKENTKDYVKILKLFN